MGKDVIIACDFDNAKDTLEFLDKFQDQKPYIKIGMELFFSETPEIVREIKRRGHKIFLDLKLHRKKGHGSIVEAGHRHGKCPLRRDNGHDEGRP